MESDRCNREGVCTTHTHVTAVHVTGRVDQPEQFMSHDDSYIRCVCMHVCAGVYVYDCCRCVDSHMCVSHGPSQHDGFRRLQLCYELIENPPCHALPRLELCPWGRALTGLSSPVSCLLVSHETQGVQMDRVYAVCASCSGRSMAGDCRPVLTQVIRPCMDLLFRHAGICA